MPDPTPAAVPTTPEASSRRVAALVKVLRDGTVQERRAVARSAADMLTALQARVERAEAVVEATRQYREALETTDGFDGLVPAAVRDMWNKLEALDRIDQPAGQGESEDG